MQAVQSLRKLFDSLPALVDALTADAVAAKPDGAWSVKEELGHLLDSAANNHQRIVRTQLGRQSLPCPTATETSGWPCMRIKNETGTN